MKKIIIAIMIFICALSFKVYSQNSDQTIEIKDIYEDHKVLEEWDNPGTYSPVNMFDNYNSTCFAEGNRDYYFTVSIELSNYTELDGIRILGGLQKDNETYLNNNRPKEMIIWLADNKEEYIQKDITIYNTRVKLEDSPKFQSIKFDKSYRLKFIIIQGLGVYQGMKYNDTCITELKFFNKGKEIPVKDVEKLKKNYVIWVGERLKDFFKGGKYQVYSTENFGKATITKTGQITYNIEAVGAEAEDIPPLPTKVFVENSRLYMDLKGKTGLAQYSLAKEKQKRLLVDSVGNYEYGNGPIFEPIKEDGK